jgi:iron-sulfur cluster repair protein YtfE (RIC family)
VKRDPSLVRLSRDHQRGLALAKRIDDVLAGKDQAPLQQLIDETLGMWETGLVPHFRAECECVLARLARQTGADNELIARTQRDHIHAHALVTSIREAGDDSERRHHLSALAAVLREHIRWEEATLFESVQMLLDAPELSRLGDDLSERIPEVPPTLPWYTTSPENG